MTDLVIKIETLGDLVELEEANKVSAYVAWLQKHSNLSRAEVLSMPLKEMASIQRQVLAQTQEALAIPKASDGQST